MQICCLNFTILRWGYSSPPPSVHLHVESPHASNGVILKANINQFCIVDCPGALCNTCGVFARMDVRRCFSTQTCGDNWAPLRGLKLYHISCTHALSSPTPRPLFFIYIRKSSVLIVCPTWIYLIPAIWLGFANIGELISLACFGN